MPELPDINVYVERLADLALEQRLDNLRIGNPFVLRTFEPKPDAYPGRILKSVGRIGKRIVLGFDGEMYAVMHLMIAGRLRWRPPSAKLPKRVGLVGFYFANGALLFTEAGSKRRASLHLVEGEAGLALFERGGVDVFQVSPEGLAKALQKKNRTLKRALTDPTIIDGIGNAYSDEILHRARLSPFLHTNKLTPEQITGLHSAAIEVVDEWTNRLRDEVGDGFPEKVTAFRPEMAVHGKYDQPCPVCGTRVQRIVYAENEMNYCPGCQTGGKVYADRALSRLLKDDWPRTLEELEELSAKRQK